MIVGPTGYTKLKMSCRQERCSASHLPPRSHASMGIVVDKVQRVMTAVMWVTAKINDTARKSLDHRQTQ